MIKRREILKLLSFGAAAATVAKAAEALPERRPIVCDRYPDGLYLDTPFPEPGTRV